jgi:hypothetical protein
MQILSVREFASDRDTRVEAAIVELRDPIARSLGSYGSTFWYEPIVAAGLDLFDEVVRATGTGQARGGAREAYRDDVVAQLERTTAPADPPAASQVDRIAMWLATFTVNAASNAALGPSETRMWLSMRDTHVRDTHAQTDGQTREFGATFDVGGFPLSYPGQPVGPPEIWMGCRCLLVPGTSQGGVMADRLTLTAAAPVDQDAPLTWHGVLAPEGLPTGDGRQFAADSLRWRELPLPLQWTPANYGAHDGAVVVGQITEIRREDGELKASGTFNSTEEATRVVDLLSRGDLRGVSVDLDDATVEYDEAADVDVVVDGRVCAATLVAIPAYAEAYVALGTWDLARQVAALAADGCLPCAQRRAALATESVSDKPWGDFTEADYTDDQWFAATVLHTNGDSRVKDDNKLPVREPDGTLNRNGVHAAAARFNQVDAPAEAKSSAAAALRGAYNTLGEEVPQVLAATTEADTFALPPELDQVEMEAPDVAVGDEVTWSDDEGEHSGVVEGIEDGNAAVQADDGELVSVPLEELTVVADALDALEAAIMAEAGFAVGTKDGPGWITNPDDTQRLRSYWVRGEGAALINWGAPGDFNRCRTQLAKYIANPQWLAGTCANLHKVATGSWPGRENAAAADAVTASPFTIVAAAAAPLAAPTDWFADPDLAGPTPLTITDEGRVYGHLATFGTCHIGVSGTCQEVPRSAHGYVYFSTGMYRTAEGDGVPVGTITMGTGHAALSKSPFATVEHYDNTGTAVAYVAAGEDAHGIWVAGSLAPDVDDAARVRLSAATLSGDWRGIGGNLELVAALAVNVPGFPVPRLATRSASGDPVALAAAGVVRVADDDAVEELLPSEVRVASAVIDALDARDARRRRAAQARSVIAAANAAIEQANARERAEKRAHLRALMTGGN